MKITPERRKLLALCEKMGITYESLSNLPQQPAFTAENIQQFLNQCDANTLSKMFYTTALVKIAEMQIYAQSNQQTEASTHAGVPDSGKS